MRISKFFSFAESVFYSSVFVKTDVDTVFDTKIKFVRIKSKVS